MGKVYCVSMLSGEIEEEMKRLLTLRKLNKLTLCLALKLIECLN